MSHSAMAVLGAVGSRCKTLAWTTGTNLCTLLAPGLSAEVDDADVGVKVQDKKTE